MRRGSFTKAGPVKVRSVSPDGEISEFVQPAYAPRGYWQIVNARRREEELASMSTHATRKAALRRAALKKKIDQGLASVQTTEATRSLD